MRSVFKLSLTAILLASSQFAQDAQTGHPLTQQERAFAVSNLNATRKMFLDAVADLTPEQWNFKAGPDRWSIAECAEHIAVSEDFISGLIREKIVAAPANPEKRSEIKVTDEQIEGLLTNRTQKFKAPEPIAPKRRWEDPQETIAHFKESRDRDIAYIETTQDALRDHLFQHPAMGMLDAYQWILVMSGHTERHTLQIIEVKADPKYPK